MQLKIFKHNKMKAIFNSKDLAIALERVGKAMNTKNILPILDNYLFKVRDTVGSIMASNLDLSIVENVCVDAYTEGRGMLIPKSTIKLLKKLGGIPITLEYDEDLKEDGTFKIAELHILTDSDKFSWTITDDIADFPQLYERGKFLGTPHSLTNIIKTLELFVSSDTLRPMTQQICITGGTATATNSFTVARMKLQRAVEGTIYIPKNVSKVVKSLKLVDTDFFEYDKGYIIVSDTTEVHYYSSEKDSEFIDTNFIFGAHTIGKYKPVLADFKKAMDKLEYVGDDSVHLAANGSFLKATCQNVDSGKKGVSNILLDEYDENGFGGAYHFNEIKSILKVIGTNTTFSVVNQSGDLHNSLRFTSEEQELEIVTIKSLS